MKPTLQTAALAPAIGQENDAGAPPAALLVSTDAEHVSAAPHWLLSAALDMARARDDWAAHGLALLRCGGLFSALRMPAHVVHAAVDTEEPTEVAERLADALEGGPVFYEARHRLYYALAEADTADCWMIPDTGTACLGPGTFLGVPAIGRTTPDGDHSYWVVPADSPGVLCPVFALTQLVVAGMATLEARGDIGRDDCE